MQLSAQLRDEKIRKRRERERERWSRVENEEGSGRGQNGDARVSDRREI